MSEILMKVIEQKNFESKNFAIRVPISAYLAERIEQHLFDTISTSVIMLDP